VCGAEQSKLRSRNNKIAKSRSKIADDDDAVAKPRKRRGDRALSGCASGTEDERPLGLARVLFFLSFFFPFYVGFIKVWPIKKSNDTDAQAKWRKSGQIFRKRGK